eukprot:TRINITY_DN4851_c0_g1_i1.p1 TRINITY_DN4851_c0_g1~~TRINITY_DN4851_c0_g1_i1.p1  ORF type:complete len:235 (+),score=33.33 TRINITY_DN4851_c0_g1_i1:77-781(+)
MNNSLNWMLEGLKYPRRLQFSVDNQQEIRGLVVWLENQKIRFYKPADRAALTDVNSSNWNEVFSKYLKDVECPISFVGSNMKDIVSWMLKHAVSLEYSDRAKEYNGYAATRAFKAQNSQNAQNAQYQNMQSKKDTAYADADQEEFQKLVQDLLRTLQVDTSKGTLADHLKAGKLLPNLRNKRCLGFFSVQGGKIFPGIIQNVSKCFKQLPLFCEPDKRRFSLNKNYPFKPKLVL